MNARVLLPAQREDIPDLCARGRRDLEKPDPSEPQYVHLDRSRHSRGILTMRGYACIALHMPKTTINVGSAMRAAFVYDARLIVTSGRRYKPVAADTMKAYRHIPFLQADNLFDVMPYDCVPVAVDLVEDACPLPRYRHPERAFYIFGPEDGTLGASVLNRCRDKVMVPTRMCMNLAATVNVILYDRMAKGCRDASEIAVMGKANEA